MGQKTGRFARTDRLRRPRQFQAVTSQGRRFASPAFVAIAARRAETAGAVPALRLGITASRKVGGAVLRNRVKRGVREWFRRSRSSLPPGFDIVVIARRPAAALGGRQLEAALSELMQGLSR